MNITEANNGQKYFGVLITPREDFFTKTTSPILVDGKETNDSDVAKYITDYLERTRFPNSEPIWFFRIIPVQVSELFSPIEKCPPNIEFLQWLMLEAITHCSGEEGLRVSRLTGLKIPAVALKWEGNEHAQTKRINRIFHLKAFRQKVDERWLTYLEPAFLNVLQEFEFRHAPVIRCMLTHGFRLGIVTIFSGKRGAELIVE